MRRRLISILLLLSMCLSLLPTALAGDAEVTADACAADVSEGDEAGEECGDDSRVIAAATRTDDYVVTVDGITIDDASIEVTVSDDMASSSQETVTVSGTNNYAEAYAVLDIVNEERAAQGLSALTMDKELLEAAMLRAAEISLLFSHTRPSNTTCFTVSSLAYGENIAAGYTDSTDVMTGWMNSEGHKANILTSGYTTIGVGCFYHNGILYWVQLFGIGTATKVSQPSNAAVSTSVSFSRKLFSDALSLYTDASYVSVGESYTVQARISNLGWDNHYAIIDGSSFTWSSDTTSVISVGSSTGALTVKKNGSATITAQTSTGKMSASTTLTAITLDTPTLTGVENTGSSGIKVTWSTVSQAVKYRVVFSAVGSSSSTTITYTANSDSTQSATLSGTSTQYTLTDGATYEIYVQAIDSNGYYSVKSEIKSIVYVASTAISSASSSVGTSTISSASNTSSGVKLSWSSVSKASGYQVWRKTGSGSYSKVTTTTSTSWTDTTVSTGKTYSYKIIAYTSSATGNASDEVTICYLAQPSISVSNASSGAKVSWDEVSGATQYLVYRKTSGGSYSKVKTVTSGTSWTDSTGLSSGTTYYYKVYAVNGSYTSEASSAVSIQYLEKTTITLSNASSGVKVSWSAVSGASKYYVYRKLSSEDSYTKIATVSSGTSYTDTGVTKGKTYCYKVYAVSGSYTSVASSALTIKYLATTTVTLSNTSSGVKVSWSAVSGASKYYVYRKLSSEDSYTKIATVSSSTSYTDTSATKGKTYNYKVCAVSGDYTGAKSSAASIRYLAKTSVTLENTSKGITVSWKKVSGASGYYVYRKTSSGSYSKIKTISSASTLSYSDTAVKSKNGTTYVYKVVAYYKNSSGSISCTSAGATKTTVRLTGTALTSVKNSASKKITVKWSAASKVTGYQIRYSTKKDFSSNCVTVTVKGSSTVSKAISSLTKNKTYYVQIRTYKTVSGTKYYSAWSSKSSVKISK